MKIKIHKYMRDSEVLESLHFKDMFNNDFMVASFYVNNETAKAKKELRQSIDQLPKIVEMIYEAGKNNEPLDIEFLEQSI